MPRRSRKSDELNYPGCIALLALLTILPAAIAILEAGLTWVGNNVALVLASIALASAIVVFGPRLLRRWWRQRRARRAAPPSADLLRILTLSSYGFELCCRELLELEGYEAVVTKQTGDEGIDIELKARDGRRGVAQCKHVLNLRIGRPTVQQLYGEMIHRGATFAFLITTGTFTDEALEWARTKTITLVDRDALLEMAARHA